MAGLFLKVLYEFCEQKRITYFLERHLLLFVVQSAFQKVRIPLLLLEIWSA